MNKQTPHPPPFSEHSNKKYLTLSVLALITILFFSAGCVSTLPEQDNPSSINLSETKDIVPFNISGNGNYHSNTVYLSGTVTVLAEVSGSESFIFSLQNENGQQTILFNEPGSSTGKHPEYYLTSRDISPGNYTLNIISVSDWDIFLSSGTIPQYLINENYAGYITGSGSQNISLSPMSKGLTIFQGYGNTSGYISAELLVNGEVSQRMDTDATGLIGLQAAYPLKTTDIVDLNIVSDNEWVFEITQPIPVLPMLFENIAGRGNYVSTFYRFNDMQNQELVFSNAGNTSIHATLYAEDGAVLTTVFIPTEMNACHYRIYQNSQQIIPITALIAITAEPDCEWSVEQCDYRVYFKRIPSKNLSQETLLKIQEKDLLEFPVLQRFADTHFTAEYVPASESEIRKLMETNYTTIEFSETYYSLSISG
ncbi:MAG: hypothetical protein O0X93_06755 [Methanocorpusculum sp.]|nr:hypothetical protein [Methanocorpusculum sp.]MDE2523622.1 hypothetical protein [Methanocorpusculum sp.]